MVPGVASFLSFQRGVHVHSLDPHESQTCQIILIIKQFTGTWLAFPRCRRHGYV